MARKRCLFCDDIVPIEVKGDYDRFLGCWCSPEGYYSLIRSSYELIRSYPHQTKRHLFPILSAYIREMTDCDQAVTLSVEELEDISNSPNIPLDLEEKGIRLLQYLYRHSKQAGEPVKIHPLSRNFNLTYSPNLQELVYIIDKLKSEEFIAREGETLRLTAKGWNEAVARAGGRKLKPCLVLLPQHAELYKDWPENVFPKIGECGYFPRLLTQLDKAGSREDDLIGHVSESKLVIADLTSLSPEVYFAAGYALGLEIPVIWTTKRTGDHKLSVPSPQIRPLIWDTAEELADKLQRKLTEN